MASAGKRRWVQVGGSPVGYCGAEPGGGQYDWHEGSLGAGSQGDPPLQYDSDALAEALDAVGLRAASRKAAVHMHRIGKYVTTFNCNPIGSFASGRKA